MDARAIAQEAFIFGFPLVLMDVSRSSMQAPPNELSHLRAFPDASFTAVVSPNADTLYSTALLDLSSTSRSCCTSPTAPGATT